MLSICLLSEDALTYTIIFSILGVGLIIFIVIFSLSLTKQHKYIKKIKQLKEKAFVFGEAKRNHKYILDLATELLLLRDEFKEKFEGKYVLNSLNAAYESLDDIDIAIHSITYEEYKAKKEYLDKKKDAIHAYKLIERYNEECKEFEREGLKKVRCFSKDDLPLLERRVKTIESFFSFCSKKNLKNDSGINYTEYRRLTNDTIATVISKNNLEYEYNFARCNYDDAYKLLDASGQALLNAKLESADLIEKIEKLINSIASKPKEIDHEISNVIEIKKEFEENYEYGKQQSATLAKGVVGASAGIAAGAATAALAPGAAMWVATTFGTTASGVAISSLSGAAATNAALAWLGGGAVAAGGTGVAGGSALLSLAGPIGIAIGAITVAGSLFFILAKKRKINNQMKAITIEINNAIVKLKEIAAKITAATGSINKLRDELENQYRTIAIMPTRDYNCFSEEGKKALGTLVNNTKSLSVLISNTISE